MRKIISRNTKLTSKKDEFGDAYLTGHFNLAEDDEQFEDLHNPFISDDVTVEVIWDDPSIENAESNDDIEWSNYKVYINGEYAGNQDDFEIVGVYTW